MADNTPLTPIQKTSLIMTGVTFVLLCILAWASVHYSLVLLLAVSVGGLGGFAHEIAQSGGKITFLKRENEDGVYLGTLAGVVLGGVAGILVIRGHLITSGGGAVVSTSMTELAYEVFTAGLALKGVTEAATGREVPKKEVAGATAGTVVPPQKPREVAEAAGGTVVPLQKPREVAEASGGTVVPPQK